MQDKCVQQNKEQSEHKSQECNANFIVRVRESIVYENGELWGESRELRFLMLLEEENCWVKRHILLEQVNIQIQ